MLEGVEVDVANLGRLKLIKVPAKKAFSTKKEQIVIKRQYHRSYFKPADNLKIFGTAY